jgi:hypothetical protein
VHESAPPHARFVWFELRAEMVEETERIDRGAALALQRQEVRIDLQNASGAARSTRSTLK